MKDYSLKEGYIPNPKIEPANYAVDTKTAAIYQVAVYAFAAKIVKKYNVKNILDIGCGYGEKLNRFIFPLCSDITGIDTSYFITYCKKNYSFGTWLTDDIEKPKKKLKRTFDLIITSDVIEHLENPDKLLAYIKKCSHDGTFIIFSSPNRDLVRGKNNLGPPENPYHIREWNMTEISSYLSSNGFHILEHLLVDDFEKSLFLRIVNTIRFKKNKTCQVLLCQKR